MPDSIRLVSSPLSETITITSSLRAPGHGVRLVLLRGTLIRDLRDDGSVAPETRWFWASPNSDEGDFRHDRSTLRFALQQDELPGTHLVFAKISFREHFL